MGSGGRGPRGEGEAGVVSPRVLPCKGVGFALRLGVGRVQMWEGARGEGVSVA